MRSFSSSSSSHTHDRGLFHMTMKSDAVPLINQEKKSFPSFTTKNTKTETFPNSELMMCWQLQIRWERQRNLLGFCTEQDSSSLTHTLSLSLSLSRSLSVFLFSFFLSVYMPVCSVCLSLSLSLSVFAPHTCRTGTINMEQMLPVTSWVRTPW